MPKFKQGKVSVSMVVSLYEIGLTFVVIMMETQFTFNTYCCMAMARLTFLAVINHVISGK